MVSLFNLRFRQTLLLLIASFALLCSCNTTNTTPISEISIIPKPQQIEIEEGVFKLPETVVINSPKHFDNAANFLYKYLGKEMDAVFLGVRNSKKPTIQFKVDETVAHEGYILDISKEKITISANSSAGAFYAVQTLRQVLSEELETLDSLPKKSIKLPIVKITDAPKFEYRGMHLDVGRHFYSKEFIKQYIAHLSMLKMNYFHWHLTEDQGWRIEILQYPDLITKGAYRDETLIGHYNDTPQQFDGKRYGGYYTQEDIKEIVAFAQEHHVTIIPEIEMPGHAQAAISAYPELGCTGGQVPVATKWGVFENIYCPKEETFMFLENVLTEVMELFPSEYIHIGGDEAPKTHWENCTHCQKLIADHDLKDENGLQSYFIKRIEKFVNSKGKKIIGWDEILEGGLAPNATVMSWRGTKGAVEAAKEGHNVILTPTSHAYFDYYQADHSDEPLAIGGFLPLKKVYGFNPIPPELSEKESKHVLGAQGNIWTEYMPTEDQVEYMAFPRMLAMSEVVWTGPSQNSEEEYPGFLSRVEKFFPRLDILDVNYANHLYDISGNIVKKNDSVFYELSTPIPNKEIRYTTTHSEEIYHAPIPITKNTTIHAAVHLENGSKGREFSENILFHKGVRGKVSLNIAPHPAYNTGGKEALINGISGSDARYGDKEWLGFWGDDLEITVQFPEPTKISKVSTRFYNANGQWIYAPNQGFVEITSKGGVTVKREVGYKINPNKTLINFEFDLSNENLDKAYKIVLKIPNYGSIPDGLQGAGNKAWTFIDEIIIE